MSKHRLILDDDYEFIAFGMSCHLKDYRVAWLMNKHLGLHYQRKQLGLESKSGQLEEFAKYVSKDPDQHLNYLLVSNHNEDVYLFSNLKQYDFFLLVEGYIDIFDSTRFKQRVQSIEGIQFVAPLDADELRPIQYALFED